MNITEFAQLAGVSKSAVSRFFNGGYLSEEKYARIEAAVQQTGYRPRVQMNMLQTRRTHHAPRTRQVGVILPKLSSNSCPRMVEGISSVLEERGYHLLLVNTANDPAKELQALDTLRQSTVDGIILIATVFTPAHKAALENLRLPVVLLGQNIAGHCCVSHDDFGAAREATALMLEKGCRAPGYLGVTLLDQAVGMARREGFLSALSAAGLPPNKQRMAVAEFKQESGYRQAERLLTRDPRIDCLFCATDDIALGAMQYCRLHHIRIPQQLMIAAVGDSSAGKTAFVPLTSAHLHYRTAGREAAVRLMEMLADPHAAPQSKVLGYELKRRASTGDTNPDTFLCTTTTPPSETI